jgi:hypothetical protein
MCSIANAMIIPEFSKNSKSTSSVSILTFALFDCALYPIKIGGRIGAEVAVAGDKEVVGGGDLNEE